MQDLNSLISSLVADLNPRQKSILVGRFALGGKNKEGLTLAELGKRYGVTRERIRQIEEAAFAVVRKKINEGEGRPFYSYVKNQMDGAGGVLREDNLIKNVSGTFGSDLKPLQLHFLIEAANAGKYFSEDKDFYSFWYANSATLAGAKSLIEKTEKHLSQNKNEILGAHNFNSVFPVLAGESSLGENVGLNYISVSKKFGVNQYGDFGLTEWPEINPKTIRDRAYLVLKNLNKPLHFRDIAAFIKERRFDSKSVHASTVHNELIKDDRFVLVGRGIYALSENGYRPGTAKEVIARVLRESGPMATEELVRLVSKERLFKENTILLNLQNRKLFKRLDDGRYHVAQA